MILYNDKKGLPFFLVHMYEPQIYAESNKPPHLVYCLISVLLISTSARLHLPLCQSKSQTSEDSEAPSATTASLNQSKLHVYNAGGKNNFFFSPCVKQPSLSFPGEKHIHHSIGSLVHFPSNL